MPDHATRTFRLAPDDVLVSLLKDLDQVTGKGPLRYLLSLLILRRRLAREVEGADADPTLLELEFVADGSRCTVKKFELTADQAQVMQNSLSDLIYCEAE
jgi:hypothetical protein